MASINVYVRLEISKSSGYIIINNLIAETKIKETYQETLESSKKFGSLEKYEVFEGFKLMHLLVENINYDGRKRKITEFDVKKTLVKQGYATKVGEGDFIIDYYKPTEKLLNQLENQLNQRKQLVKEGKFILLKEAQLSK